VAVDTLVYGGPLTSGYAPGGVTFSLSAILPNLRYLPIHVIEAMPMLVLGLAAIVWIIRRRGHTADARRDFAIALALAASWMGVWGLYATYTWTATPGGSTLQVVRFYVPAVGAIALLGAWLVVNLPRRAASIAAVAVIVALFGLGVWNFDSTHQFSGIGHYGQRTGGPGGLPPSRIAPGSRCQPAILPGRQRAGGSRCGRLLAPIRHGGSGPVREGLSGC
jgi:hypothetical protein